jgi:hypothetical protein
MPYRVDEGMSRGQRSGVVASKCHRWSHLVLSVVHFLAAAARLDPLCATPTPTAPLPSPSPRATVSEAVQATREAPSSASS